MRLIVITRPRYFEGEAEAITALFDAGLERLHLRKPGSSEEELRMLIEQFPENYRQRIVIHDHFPLATEYHLGGIHLNSRNPEPLPNHAGSVSRSCHTLREVIKYKPDCDYLFLSPIYDSISKEGYGSTFAKETLREARRQGIIDAKVIALGGVCLAHLPEIRSLGFGGAAVLGAVWNHPGKDFVEYFKQLNAL